MIDKKVKEILASYLSAKEELGKIAPTFNWSNLLGDYGEYIAINEFELTQAEISTKGYDAINKKGQTVQIKTIRDTTRSIKFKKVIFNSKIFLIGKFYTGFVTLHK